MTNTEKALNDFGELVIKSAQKRLVDSNSNASKRLSNSLRYEAKVNKNSIEFDFYAEDYWKFVDQGVKGKASSVKAPNSPFRFGTGTGKKGGLTSAIDKWVIRKGFGNVRGKDGRFITRAQMVKAIARSIYMRGIAPTHFFSKAYEEQFPKLADKLEQSYGTDLEEFLIKNIKTW